MTTVRWVCHETNGDDLAHSSGDWSRPRSIKDTVAQFAELGNQSRRVSIIVTCCVAEVVQNDGMATIVLKGVDAADSASLRLEFPSALQCTSTDSLSLPLDTKADTPTQEGPFGVPSDVSSSTSLTSLAVLRSCLAGESEAAMVRWMWDDVGLSGTRRLARLNPLRWSKWQNIENAANDLERYIGKEERQRPVRLVIFPNVMTSFVTRTSNPTDAWMALRELMGRTTDSTTDSTGRAWTALTREDSFMSCDEIIVDDDHELVEGMSFRGSSSVCTKTLSTSPRKKKTSTNPNKISHFSWLLELLESITNGTARALTANANPEYDGTPLFVVAGACPNNLCGMQAVLYSQVPEGIDFWWIKPQSTDPGRLEQKTLHRHSTGPFRNVAARAKHVYAPLAEKFSREENEQGNLVFGVDEVGRAYIGESRMAGQRVRMLLYFVWQESWSSLLSRKPFLEGKLFYQLYGLEGGALPAGSQTRIFCRQYRIESGDLTLAPWQDEEEIVELLPADSIQDMYIMTGGKQ